MKIGTCDLRYPSGRTYQLKESDIFGEVGFLTGNNPGYEVVSLENVEIYTYEASLLNVLFTRNPSLGASFYQHLIIVAMEKNSEMFF